jgi:hypothetical protein
MNLAIGGDYAAPVTNITDAFGRSLKNYNSSPSNTTYISPPTEMWFGGTGTLSFEAIVAYTADNDRNSSTTENWSCEDMAVGGGSYDNYYPFVYMLGTSSGDAESSIDWSMNSVASNSFNVKYDLFASEYSVPQGFNLYNCTVEVNGSDYSACPVTLVPVNNTGSGFVIQANFGQLAIKPANCQQ